MSTRKWSFLREKWKEYSIEFFSLFAAVTLSFFADNLREELQIKQQMKGNYQDLLQDLRQDSIRIDALKESSHTQKMRMNQLLNIIYNYQDKKITWEQVKLNMPNTEELPFYFTLIMSNSAFNSMQSSGMLSEINNSKLLQQLTYYYDVLGKKVDESNTIYDVDRRRFYDEYFPLIQPSYNRRLDSTEGVVNALSAPYRNPRLNKEFILNLPIAKQIMSDPQTLFRSEAFYLRFGTYLQLLKTLGEENKKLITTVESVLKD